LRNIEVKLCRRWNGGALSRDGAERNPGFKKLLGIAANSPLRVPSRASFAPRNSIVLKFFAPRDQSVVAAMFATHALMRTFGAPACNHLRHPCVVC
jgi:hypothetical protein